MIVHMNLIESLPVKEPRQVVFVVDELFRDFGNGDILHHMEPDPFNHLCDALSPCDSLEEL